MGRAIMHGATILITILVVLHLDNTSGAPSALDSDRDVDRLARRNLGHPGLLSPIIPDELNGCKVMRNGQVHYAEYNAKCNKCEHCDKPCHVFNDRLCRCNKRPF